MAELRKIQVPDGTLRVEIDDPQNRCIEKTAGAIRGWFATRGQELPESFCFQLCGKTLPHTLENRMDVEAALPGYAIVGFKIEYDLTDYLLYIQNNRLGIQLQVSDYEPYFLRFTVEDSALAVCLAAAGGV